MKKDQFSKKIVNPELLMTELGNKAQKLREKADIDPKNKVKYLKGTVDLLKNQKCLAQENGYLMIVSSILIKIIDVLTVLIKIDSINEFEYHNEYAQYHKQLAKIALEEGKEELYSECLLQLMCSFNILTNSKETITLDEIEERIDQADVALSYGKEKYLDHLIGVSYLAKIELLEQFASIDYENATKRYRQCLSAIDEAIAFDESRKNFSSVHILFCKKGGVYQKLIRFVPEKDLEYSKIVLESLNKAISIEKYVNEDVKLVALLTSQRMQELRSYRDRLKKAIEDY